MERWILSTIPLDCVFHNMQGMRSCIEKPQDRKKSVKGVYGFFRGNLFQKANIHPYQFLFHYCHFQEGLGGSDACFFVTDRYFPGYNGIKENIGLGDFLVISVPGDNYSLLLDYNLVFLEVMERLYQIVNIPFIMVQQKQIPGTCRYGPCLGVVDVSCTTSLVTIYMFLWYRSCRCQTWGSIKPDDEQAIRTSGDLS